MRVAACLRVVVACLVLYGLTGTSSVRADNVRLIGSGASFPFPIYSTWFKSFSSKTKGVTVDYQAKGSGAGIQDFVNKTVDFAASDAAMSDEELAKVDGGAVLLPMTAGEIVLAYNLDGVDTLNLPRDVYPDILLGKITKWNDERIVKANPGVKLPDEDITVVVRSDSSGTTYVFTQHLAAISDDFKNGPGVGKTVQWPVSDKFVKAPKNDGITATIKQTPGAIGYIEYGYAKLTKAKTAALENKDGQFVQAGPEAGAAALASAEFPGKDLPGLKGVPDLRVWVTDPSGEKSYPIATFTWMLFYLKQDPKKADVLRNLVEYCLTDGQKVADKIGYIPLPENVVAKVHDASKLIQ
ncbi:MAG: phosphate ABC transporter substrate-binding protein PstS [Hyphomicrobiales bacterium]|nr:phosphate ABC transporter substrate-binding protein PstS [Hyphomicrobiales bacterium]